MLSCRSMASASFLSIAIYYRKLQHTHSIKTKSIRSPRLVRLRNSSRRRAAGGGAHHTRPSFICWCSAKFPAPETTDSGRVSGELKGGGRERNELRRACNVCDAVVRSANQRGVGAALGRGAKNTRTGHTHRHGGGKRATGNYLQA